LDAGLLEAPRLEAHLRGPRRLEHVRADQLRPLARLRENRPPDRPLRSLDFTRSRSDRTATSSADASSHERPPKVKTDCSNCPAPSAARFEARDSRNLYRRLRRVL
jgi:hypothetical protein